MILLLNKYEKSIFNKKPRPIYKDNLTIVVFFINKLTTSRTTQANIHPAMSDTI